MSMSKLEALNKSMNNTNIFKSSFSSKAFIYARNLVYMTIGVLSAIFPSRKPKIVVYCYHSISNDGWRFSVTKENFEKQINFLLKNQQPIKSSDLDDYISGKKKLEQDSFVITFDDGYEDVLSVKDFLSGVGVFPTMFVLSDRESVLREELETDRPLLSDRGILELKQSGWEIGSHGATHTDFSKLKSDEITAEVLGSKEKIEKSIGVSVEYFAYPKGRYTVEVLEYVEKAKYKLAFSVNDGYVNRETSRFLIPRVGVDGTHTMKQFPYLALPLSMLFRKVLKKII